MRRGDVVRPTVEAVDRTGFRPSSRLTVKQRQATGWKCRGCGVPLRRGRLYAAGAEVTSNLCLSCVEPVEGAA